MTSSRPWRAGDHVAIIGAGVVGACCAVELAWHGFRVTVFDPAEPGAAGASRGNAGHIAPSEVVPLASPGIGTRALRMLLDPNAPLKIPPSQWFRLTPWLAAFLLNSRPDSYRRNAEALARINSTVWEDLETLFGRAGLLERIERPGGLYLYESEASFAAAKPGWQLRAEHGFDWRELSAGEICALEPKLAPLFPRGLRVPSFGCVADPRQIVLGLVDHARGQGVEIRCERVLDMRTRPCGIDICFATGHSETFDGVIVAAGVWSRQLLRHLEGRIPVEAERGYNVTYHSPGFKLSHPIVFGDRGIVASQINDGVRVGGWAELGGVARPPQRRYFERLDKIAKRLLPALNGSEAEYWMGHRPSTPTSVPIIRKCRSDARVLIACGHGHLGLTQAATTARLARELAMGVQ